MLSELIGTNMNYRCLALEFADEGVLTFEDLALMCLKYMSNDDVEDMLRYNQFDDLIKEYSVH